MSESSSLEPDRCWLEEENLRIQLGQQNQNNELFFFLFLLIEDELHLIQIQLWNQFVLFSHLFSSL